MRVGKLVCIPPPAVICSEFRIIETLSFRQKLCHRYEIICDQHKSSHLRAIQQLQLVKTMAHLFSDVSHRSHTYYIKVARLSSIDF